MYGAKTHMYSKSSTSWKRKRKWMLGSPTKEFGVF
jgi:hypothetical protein